MHNVRGNKHDCIGRTVGGSHLLCSQYPPPPSAVCHVITLALTCRAARDNNSYHLLYVT